MKVIVLLLIVLNLSFAQMTGSISGKIIDSKTKQPLVLANVHILNLDIGTATNTDGYFSLDNIPNGTNHVIISMIGYEKKILYNLRISSVRPLSLTIELDISPIELTDINVTRKLFAKSSSSVMSTMLMDQAEIRSDPIGIWDVQRVVQSLPSVNQIADQINGIIIRGGSPGENLFIMDNIEIQNPNHFGVEEIGGGGMNLINPAFINDIEFTPGAFSARFGDKASSVMNMSLREGSRSNFELDFDLSIGGLGIITEGPIKSGRGSFLIGSSWSYLDYIVTNNLEYTSVPHYNHHQAKLVYDLNPNKKLIFNLLAALDDIKVEAVEEIESFYGIENINHDNALMIGGLTVQRLLGNLGYSNFTISYSRQSLKQNAYELGFIDFPWFNRNNNIEVISFNNNWILRTKFGEISTGLDLKSIKYELRELASPDFTYIYDTEYWQDGKWEFPDEIYEPKEVGIIHYRPTYISNQTKYFSKYAYYFQNKFNIRNFLELTAGFRFDYFSATNNLELSPRLNAQFSLNPVNSIYIAFGRHYQFPDYQMVLRSDFNRKLKTKFADHFALGFEHFFDEDFRATVELYYKYYQEIYTYYYWSNDVEVYPARLNHIFHWLNGGSGENFGAELFIQKKLSKNWHGLLSYSWSEAKAKDVRSFNQIPEPITFKADGNWYDWDYNIKHKLTISGGWKKRFSNNKWYNENKNRLLFKIFSPIIPIADELELSFRFLYSSGRPYTNKEYVPQLFDWQIPQEVVWNGDRYPNYHRFDLLFLRRYNLNNYNLVIYIDFLNIFDTDNLFDYLYNSDGTKSNVWHLKTLPLFGITLEL